MRSAIAHRALLAFLSVLLLVTGAPAHAHDGHDHGAPPTPVSSTIAPRADASSTDFEIVVIARGDKLAIFLDTFRENQPVDGAAIEIDAPGGILTPTADGSGQLYASPLPSSPSQAPMTLRSRSRPTASSIS